MPSEATGRTTPLGILGEVRALEVLRRGIRTFLETGLQAIYRSNASRTADYVSIRTFLETGLQDSLPGHGTTTETRFNPHFLGDWFTS